MNRVPKIVLPILATVLNLKIVGAVPEVVPAHYYWKASPAGDSAQLLTLFCRACEDSTSSGRDIPLVTVLRDTLGDIHAENDRVSYVWLLTYSRPTWQKRLFSAVPFFYWKIGDGSAKVGKIERQPLMNLTAPQRSVISSGLRTIVQWTALDPLSTSVRATTRAYQNNRLDHERLHLEEAEGYLQSAPAADDESGLNEKELNAVIARLELRKSTLGGFVSERRAAGFGEDANFEQERVRARNWELLRQYADKTGLIFEPIDLAGAKNQYAVLWFPFDRAAPPEGTALGPVWKLLNLTDPYTQRAELLTAPHYERTFEDHSVQLAPLGVYSLTYPKMPLLMIDFRDGAHLRRHELTQRAINEVTSGVIGISRITNWYYYAGATVYNFWASRRGTAVNRRDRLNAYSRFRVALALDATLEPNLRLAMQHQVDSLAINPLETSPQSEMRAALQRYDLLHLSAAQENGQIAHRLEKDRRAELARFEAAKSEQVRDSIFHYSTFGLYTHRAGGDEFLDALDKYRQVDYYLTLLDGLTASGRHPDVTYDRLRIKSAVSELSTLLPEIASRAVREHAARTIERLRGVSADSELRAECAAALIFIRESNEGGSAGAATEGALEGSGDPEVLR